jgi:hypothetical protein
MKIVWKLAVSVVCIVVILAAAALVWRTHKHRIAAEQMSLLQAKAEQGDAESQVRLGRAFHYGLGISRDLAACLSWYRKAADQGYARGEDGIGYLYYTGDGVTQDYAEAFRWFSKAATQGDAFAQDMLGTMSYYGRGVPPDYNEALRWYRKAADQGDPTAELDLGSVYYSGKAVPKDYAQAAEWYRKAAAQGNARAEYDLGYMYRYGKGVPRNFWEARRLFRQAAAQDDEKAMRAITCGLTTTAKVSIAIQVLGGLFLAVSFVRVRMNYFAVPHDLLSLREKVTGVAGILFLIDAGYSWYGYTHSKFLNLLYGCNSWTAIKWLFVPVLTALCIAILRVGGKTEAE